MGRLGTHPNIVTVFDRSLYEEGALTSLARYRTFQPFGHLRMFRFVSKCCCSLRYKVQGLIPQP